MTVPPFRMPTHPPMRPMMLDAYGPCHSLMVRKVNSQSLQEFIETMRVSSPVDRAAMRAEAVAWDRSLDLNRSGFE